MRVFLVNAVNSSKLIEEVGFDLEPRSAALVREKRALPFFSCPIIRVVAALRKPRRAYGLVDR